MDVPSFLWIWYWHFPSPNVHLTGFATMTHFCWIGDILSIPYTVAIVNCSDVCAGCKVVTFNKCSWFILSGLSAIRNPAGPDGFGLTTTQYFALKLLFLILLQYIFIIKEQLYALSSSPNVIRLIKSRRMRWAENVARIEGTREEHTGLLWGDVKERDHLEELDIEGRIILNGSFGSWMGGKYWIALDQSRDRLMAVVNAVLNLQIP